MCRAILVGLLASTLGFLPVELRAADDDTQPLRQLAPWTEGILEIHHVNTGRGEAVFLVLPDGTTLLVDAGDAASMDRPEGFTPPPRPDGSKPAGTWIGRYVRARHPDGPEGQLDYVLLTHFHPDHIDGLTDAQKEIPFRTLLDRSWPETRRMRGAYRDGMERYEAFRKAFAEGGGEVQRFEAGRRNQIALRRAPARYGTFEIRNLAVNGTVWTGNGEAVKALREAGEPGQENNCSAAFLLRYGRFAYFNGADVLARMEELVAPVVGPVDVHVANHHGSEACEAFLRALRPRVHIVQVWDAIQPRWQALDRLLDETLYPGPRDVFLTNGLWPGRADHVRAGPSAFPEEAASRYLKNLAGLPATQGHIVVRVAPGGETYQVLALDDTDETFRIRSRHGPYLSGAKP